MPQPFTTHLDTLQRRIGQELFARVAGPEGPANRERFRKSGPRWFTDDRPIRRVHGDAAMFVGGLRALLLQSLHPVAMIAVAQHSDYREDPWGRLQRTSTFLAATTYGTVEDAQRAVDRVRRVHEHVTGITPDGRSYRAADPHLLRWVHVAETDSFLRCHQRYGARPLDEAGCDGYVADTARIAIELGVPDPPRTRGDLNAALRAYRPELRGSAEAREAARFLVRNPPLPLLARGPYTLLAAAAVGELPAWARRELRLPAMTGADALLVRPAGQAIGFSPLVTHALVRVPVHKAADASGVLTTALQLGQAMGVAVFGSVFLTLAARGPGSPGAGAPAAAAVSGHALYVTLAWAALAMALAVAAAIPLARTVLAARRAG